MAKTLIDIDDDLLEAARAALGTSTKKDTVNSALRSVLDMQHRIDAVEELAAWGQRHEPWAGDQRDRAWRR